MRADKNIFVGIVLLVMIISFSSFSLGYMKTTNIQTTQYTSADKSFESFNKEVCQQGQDFIIQISPLGCTPAVVRSDLLEESDVPVYCQLAATKINPLIEVKAIDTISFSGQYPPQVSGVGFHQAKSALGITGDLNSPVLNNIGYVVINLKKQANVSAIPNSVSGTLTAKIKYNVNKAFGIGNALFYLPLLDDNDWNTRKSQYSFWNGKGYIRADNIESNQADISIYTDTGKLSTVRLEKGQTSNILYLPGFECQAGLKLKLESLENTDTRAKLNINSEIVEVTTGEKFLENKCTLLSIKKNGLSQKVNINCQEDEKTNSPFSLTISPKILVTVDKKEKIVQLGEKLYEEYAIQASYDTPGLTVGQKYGVYLAYVGSEGDSKYSKDLSLFLVAMPLPHADKLSDAELASWSLFKDLMDAKIPTSGPLTQASAILDKIAGGTIAFSRFMGLGQSFWYLKQGPTLEEDVFKLGKHVSLVGFAGVQDSEIKDETAKEQYDNAKADYETIRNSFSSEVKGTSTYGEEALYNEIVLVDYANQKATVAELCDEFKRSYPDSEKDLSGHCSEYRLSNSETGSVHVVINKQVREISLDEIYEPSFEDFGATVVAATPTGTKSFDLRKNRVVYLDSSDSYLQLISLEDNSARVQIGVTTAQGTKIDYVQLERDVPNNFEVGYTFTLADIKLKKSAKVSVIPSISNAGTSANFSFKIGIEKRAITLPPETIKKKIKDLNGQISMWQNVSTVLGNVTQGLKTACVLAETVLVAKNFILNTGGKGIARQSVMKDASNGWYTRCINLAKENPELYSSQEDCLNKNSENIDKDVEKLGKSIDELNSENKKLEEGVTTTGLLGERAINTNDYIKKKLESGVLVSVLPSSVSDASGKKTIETSSLLANVLTTDGYKNRLFTSEQLNDMELYSKVLKDNSASPELQSIARSKLYSVLSDVQENSENYLKIKQVSENLGIDASKIAAVETEKDIKTVAYTGMKNSQLQTPLTGTGINSETPVQIVQLLPSGKTYTVALDNTPGTLTYTIKDLKSVTTVTSTPVTAEQMEAAITSTPTISVKSGLAIFDSSNVLVDKELVISDFKKMYFKKYDSSTYQNPYKNAELRYYETEPYKGMPALVPFDLANGWYASINHALSAGTASYEASGRVSSFWVCNVGENGLEENKGGDDLCQLINTGTGQAYNVFHGLSSTEASAIINKADKAIEQASKIQESQRKGYVSIAGQRVKVGSPAVDTPEIQCQDTMSPSDCLLMFNLCDPVICPSSRCDLGGAYPVKDVIQSGIIGSIFLCLPNAQEGIILPVCLTGIKAGIDGFLSVMTATRDCLQENLNSGKMVGICDEIYSFYMCDLLWKQALPVANMIIPKLLEIALGQNVRGGGEYLGVQSAWDTASKSINYFTDYYGANAKEAFFKRTTEAVQGEVCKSFISGVVPSGSDFLNTITQPDSPAQFTGRFDEIPMTSATVPPTSQYKVFYHIYAGKDSGVYYKVYLKGSPTSSYYQDTASSVAVASGYIAVGGYASDTKDFIATSGYKQLCLNVNGQEECGFKEVSTSFAVNYVKDEYLKSQATATDIKTEDECVSGTASAYSLLNPNVQSGVESTINPSIYDEGIIRFCATSNPGKGTDANAGMNNSRFVEVGYCGEKNIKCWLDTESVKNVIQGTAIEGDTLSNVTSNYLNVLKNQEGYLSESQFSSAVQEIEGKTESLDKIDIINNIIEKVFYSNEKSKLLLLRGDAYAALFRAMWSPPKPAAGTEPTITAPVAEKTRDDVLKLTDAGERVVLAANLLRGTIVPGKIPEASYKMNEHCWTAVMYAYIYSQVKETCIYSDIPGKVTYKFNNEHTNGQKVTITIGTTKVERIDKNGNKYMGLVARASSQGACTFDSSSISSKEKLDKLKPGYILSILWNGEWAHNVIFLGWVNEGTREAELFDWNAMPVIQSGERSISGELCTSEEYIEGTTHCKSYRIYTAYLNDDVNPVYQYWQPVISTSSVIPKEIDNADNLAPPVVTDITTSALGNKILNAAAAIYASCLTGSTTAGCSDEAARFVSRVLVNAGVLGVESKEWYGSSIPSTIISLTSALDKRSDFSEIEPASFEKGDIILIGHVCDLSYSVGIVSDRRSDGTILYYTNKDGKIQIETIKFNTEIKDDFTSVTSIFTGSKTIYPYIYRVYRYTGDLSDAAKINVATRKRWTLEEAITHASGLQGYYIDGLYTDNKKFVDQLIFDGILNGQDCKDVRSSALGSEKDMVWLRKLLASKSASGTQATSETQTGSHTVPIPSTKYYTYQTLLEKYAASNQPTKGTTPMTVNSFKALLAAIAQYNNWGGGGTNVLGKYNDYQTIFEKYAPTQNSALAEIISPTDFKALLAAIAEFNNWGGSTSNWFMGYETGSYNMEKDDQVKVVSGFIKTGLIGPYENAPSFTSCKYSLYSNLKGSIECTLNAMKKQGMPNLDTAKVLALWDKWKGYLANPEKYSSTGSWIMGYNTGEVSYQGTEKQISTVSEIIKSVLEGTIDSKSEYHYCISTTVLKDRMHCVLSVLKTGKRDYSAGILSVVGIGKNTEGIKYADSVISLWTNWENYFISIQ